jgi:hypothetical protein
VLQAYGYLQPRKEIGHPNLSQFNPNLLQLNPSLSQFNPDLSQRHPDLTGLKAGEAYAAEPARPYTIDELLAVLEVPRTFKWRVFVRRRLPGASSIRVIHAVCVLLLANTVMISFLSRAGQLLIHAMMTTRWTMEFQSRVIAETLASFREGSGRCRRFEL